MSSTRSRRSSSPPGPPASIDAYLATVEPGRKAALERLRKTIHAIVPKLEECISYSMPAFRRDGHVIAGFLATTKGCSYLPFSGTTLETLAAELASYSQTKSSLHFTPDRPLPTTLVRKLLKARIAETATKRATTKRAAKKPATTKRAVKKGA